MMQDGMQVDQNMLISVLQNKLSQASVREAQLEAAVQQLMAENNEVRIQLQTLSEVKAEEADASTNA